MGVSGPTGTETPQPDIDTTNDYLLGLRQNLPNSSWSQQGLSKFITQSLSEIPVFRTKQDAYRHAAWLVTLAEILPDTPEEQGMTFDQVLHAVRNA